MGIGHSWASECPDVKNYKWWLNAIWHKMLYSWIHKETVGVKELWWLSNGTLTHNTGLPTQLLDIYSTCVNVCQNNRHFPAPRSRQGTHRTSPRVALSGRVTRTRRSFHLNWRRDSWQTPDDPTATDRQTEYQSVQCLQVIHNDTKV